MTAWVSVIETWIIERTWRRISEDLPEADESDEYDGRATEGDPECGGRQRRAGLDGRAMAALRRLHVDTHDGSRLPEAAGPIRAEPE